MNENLKHFLRNRHCVRDWQSLGKWKLCHVKGEKHEKCMCGGAYNHSYTG